MLTAPQLIAGARGAKVTITQRQIDEWQRAGFLPAPTREKLPGQGRGRAPYQYPDQALDAVIWLGTHRRFIDGDDVASFWLWLEGFDYIPIDPIMFLLAEVYQDWNNLRASIPSLPNIKEILDHGWDDTRIEDVLNEWDAIVTVPALASGALDDRTAPRSYLEALAYGIQTPELVDPARGAMTAEAAAHFDQPLTGERLAHLAQELPHSLRAMSLVSIYRQLFAAAQWARVREHLIAHSQELDQETATQLCAEYNDLLTASIQPWELRNWWHYLTPEMIAMRWPGRLPGAPRIRTRVELLRYWRYDPLSFVQFVADVQDQIKREMRPPGLDEQLKQIMAQQWQSPAPAPGTYTVTHFVMNDRGVLVEIASGKEESSPA